MASYRIGAAARMLDMSVDTLRYYEKLGLLPGVSRNHSGIRFYDDRDISRLKFIKRAQQMDFSLAEIADLLKMREAPHKARKQVRELTARKFAEVGARVQELQTLRNELQLLLNLCRGTGNGCPIIETMDRSGKLKKRKKRRA